MALKKDVVIQKQNFDGSLVARNAYWKITNIGGNKNGFSISVDAFLNGVFYERKTSAFIPDLNGTNFIAQAYEHLKTLPEFAGATDC
jgi:hypothetical protein